MAKIIHTDNFGGDYPDEKFVEGLPVMNAEQAQSVANAINMIIGQHSPRYYRVVPDDYKLVPGFEP